MAGRRPAPLRAVNDLQAAGAGLRPASDFCHRLLATLSRRSTRNAAPPSDSLTPPVASESNTPPPPPRPARAKPPRTLTDRSPLPHTRPIPDSASAQPTHPIPASAQSPTESEHG